MHELFLQVLDNKDLSKAGDLFSVPDDALINDIAEIIKRICEITNSPNYVVNNNDQSLVEISITRITSAIRETDSMAQHAEGMVAILDTCLNHNLKPGLKNEDPPHAKIASDIISCIFLNYSKKDVMKRILPVAVKFLHKGNKELSRNLASYLSLAAINNALLLSKHIQLIIDSIITGNYVLCRVLPQMYEVTKETIHEQTIALVSLLPVCDLSERLSLLQLFALIANTKCTLLEERIPQLCEYLVTSSTSVALHTMQVFLNLAQQRPEMLVDHVDRIKDAADNHPTTVCLAIQIITEIGKMNQEKAKDALNFILQHLPKVDRSSQSFLIRGATQLCSTFPAICTDEMLADVWKCSRRKFSDPSSSKPCIEDNSDKKSIEETGNGNGVTIVKLNGSLCDNNNNAKLQPIHTSSKTRLYLQPQIRNGTLDGHYVRHDKNRFGFSPRAKLIGDSRSTSRLHTSVAHRSTNKINGASGRIGSIGGLHKSMTKLTSSQPNRGGYIGNSRMFTSNCSRQYSVTAPSANKLCCGGITITTPSANTISKAFSTAKDDHMKSSRPQLGSSQSGESSYHMSQSDIALVDSTTLSRDYSQSLSPLHPLSTPGSSPLNQSLIITTNNQSNPAILQSLSGSIYSDAAQSVLVSRRQLNGSVTAIENNKSNTAPALSQRISVFEPYPMRDTIQHFCEKHLDKIRLYMEQLIVRMPLPAKCTIEERRAKKMVKLHFACQGRGEHCLYNRTFFVMKTRSPKTWIHLMFLALQARSTSALSSRHTAVTSLKNCWDILKCENRTFLTLVTSAFPCFKDQELLLNELRRCGFCDVFEFGPELNLWCCFLCIHPERAVGFLQNSQPVIEGQLKEKKGRWKLFKRWKTRYFTLSGAHLSYKESKDDKDGVPIDVHQIRSVKVSRGSRNIPKAFEIFTGQQSLILKPKRGTNAEEWVQCLSVVVAHSQANAKESHSRSSTLIRGSV